MLKTFSLSVAGLLALAPMPANAPLQVLQTFTGPDGSYDYASFDDTSGRVYFGREFGVMTLDPKTGRTATLLVRQGVAAVLPIAGTRLMLSTNGDTNNATLFDRDTGRVVADIDTGEEPDGAYYDRGSGLAFVSNAGSGTVTVIDVQAAKAVSTIDAGGAPEGAVSDGKGRLFVNVEEPNSIAVIDIATRKVIARYALNGCDEPNAIAYDPLSGTLISACKNGVAKLISAKTGRDRGTLPVGQRADGSLFDAKTRIGTIPALDGVLTRYSLDARGIAKVQQSLRTREGARTAAYDAARGLFYLPFATVERDATGKYLRARSDFGVLVVGKSKQ